MPAKKKKVRPAAMSPGRRKIVKHIQTVFHYLDVIIYDLRQRAFAHDLSKLRFPERQVFETVRQKARYGTTEYEDGLKRIGQALAQHYSANRHHPQHHPNGVDDMNLMDLIEMLADWKAASETEGNDIRHSIEVGKTRFNLSDQLVKVMSNTADYLDW